MGLSPADAVLIGDRAVTTVAVNESDDPMVDVGVQGLLVDDRLADEFGYYRMLRLGVVHRLLVAQNLLPDGWRLAVIEGYRPLSTQLRYFTSYRDELAGLHPSLTDEELFRLATRHIAPALEDGHPPHSTGGAVDLTVYDSSGCEIDVGCPVNATPEESAGACYTAAAGLELSQRRDRLVLIRALGQAGLVNYSPEWWHWSYGDQYWALQTGAEYTLYARLDEDSVRSSRS